MTNNGLRAITGNKINNNNNDMSFWYNLLSSSKNRCHCAYNHKLNNNAEYPFVA